MLHWSNDPVSANGVNCADLFCGFDCGLVSLIDDTVDDDLHMRAQLAGNIHTNTKHAICAKRDTEHDLAAVDLFANLG